MLVELEDHMNVPRPHAAIVAAVVVLVSLAIPGVSNVDLSAVHLFPFGIRVASVTFPLECPEAEFAALSINNRAFQSLKGFFVFTGPDELRSWIMSVPPLEEFSYGHATDQDIRGAQVYARSLWHPYLPVASVTNVCLSSEELEMLQVDPGSVPRIFEARRVVDEAKSP